MNNWKYTILWIAAIVVVFIVKDRVDKKREERHESYNHEAYLDTIRHYKDKLGREVAEKQSIILSSEKVLKENDSLKSFIKGMKPSVVVKTETVYRDTGMIKFDTIYKDACIPFSEKGKWRYISGKVMEDGIHFDHFEVYSRQYMAVGTKRKWLLGDTEHVVRIVNENPYMTMTDIQPLTIRERKKWFEKWWVWGIIGLTGGILISK